MDEDEINIFRQQKRSYVDFGFNQWLEKPIAVEGSALGFLSTDDVNALFQGISASKATSGIQISKTGRLAMDWDNGTLTVTFPGDSGFLKIGVLGTDELGNEKFGILLNDGTDNRGFWGI